MLEHLCRTQKLHRLKQVLLHLLLKKLLHLKQVLLRLMVVFFHQL
jgi:hypothetical protein